MLYFRNVELRPLLARVGTWLLLVALLYLLRSFFLLIFLTFVFGFLQARGVDNLGRWITHRTVRVWIVGLALLGVISGLAFFLTPSIKKQTEIFVLGFDSYAEALDAQLYNLANKSPIVAQTLEDLTHAPYAPNDSAAAYEENSPTVMLVQQLAGIHDLDDTEGGVSSLLSQIVRYSSKVVGIASAFLLSLLFSFLIVLDLPRLSRSVSGLRHSKLRFAYCEVAPSLFRFARLLGQALEAQFFVALVNCLLTAIGLWLLGLGQYLAFLSTIVFLFSFVPVAGVFISSVPICMVALQAGGLHSVMFAIGLITLIHMMEGYVLNPRIYGSHFRINPVVVLVILTIGGKLFHFWGLVLGVPLCTWFFTHAIRMRRGRDGT